VDGLLVVDKPSGPTSHDVVARMRRVLREKRIGHTGTLDPLATGVLPLVIGRATRLARFLSGSDKTYEAAVRLGVATDTADAEGATIGTAHQGPLPGRAEIDRALDAFRGSFLQRPPVYSAKRIGGVRSYDLARGGGGGGQPEAVSVRVCRLEVLDLTQNLLTLSLDCSAGFYVRSLAHDLGVRLGVGAHLAALRRTRCAGYDLGAAIPLAEAERDPAATAAAVIPMRRMLLELPAVILAGDDVRKAVNGRDIAASAGAGPIVRLLDEAEDLVGLGECDAPGLLHPSVILR
jgi:tRNA pseudouridine55 synthase